MSPYVRALLMQPDPGIEHEQALAHRMRAGDRSARDELITLSMRLVVMRARQWGLRGDDLDDAVQSGAIGLIRAVDRFDPARGVRLGTFAWHWIGAAMATRLVPLNGAELVDLAGPPQLNCENAEIEGLEELPDELRRVVVLRFGLASSRGSGQSRREVAHMLGLSVAQVRSRESKAMRQLRGRLARVSHRAPR